VLATAKSTDLSCTLTFFQKNNLRVVPELIGTRKASTFRGFCSTHDANLFAAAEHQPFTATSEQLSPLNFRAVARRVYARHVAVRHAPRLLNYDRGLPAHVQREWFATQHRDVVNAQETLRNTEDLKRHYDRIILQRDFCATNAYVAHFSGTPEFLCVELVNTDFDFSGQALKEPPPPAHVCAYNVATNDGWAFVFSWSGDNPAAEALALSFDRRSDHEKAVVILSYALEYTDNIFFAPKWWESQSPSERAYVVFALTRRMHPHYLRDSRLLLHANRLRTEAQFMRAERVGPWRAAA
jgi:hypothetical protein